MKIKVQHTKTIILVSALFLAGSLYSCNSKKNKNNTQEKSGHQEMVEGHSHNGMMDEDEHHDEEMHEAATGQMSWQPAQQPFEGQLKLVKGDEAKLNAKVVKMDGSNVLNIEPDGQEVVLMLNNVFGNFGAEFQYQLIDYTGKLALLFHYQDESNYDAMVFDNKTMKLERMNDGQIKVLDSHDAQFAKGWSTLKISAAGEHLKCYLNGKQYDHGHAEVRPAGQFGIMLQGKGTVLLKKLSLVPLQE